MNAYINNFYRIIAIQTSIIKCNDLEPIKYMNTISIMTWTLKLYKNNWKWMINECIRETYTEWFQHTTRIINYNNVTYKWTLSAYWHEHWIIQEQMEINDQWMHTWKLLQNDYNSQHATLTVTTLPIRYKQEPKKQSKRLKPKNEHKITEHNNLYAHTNANSLKRKFQFEHDRTALMYLKEMFNHSYSLNKCKHTTNTLGRRTGLRR